MRAFDIPDFYRSPLITEIKKIRKERDPRKRDFAPTYLDFGSVSFYIARHFGFCYGVENAIEISFRALAENPGKRIFLLSQMIHNPEVNKDLEAAGVKFLQDTEGNSLLPFSELEKGDLVIIPAFGTTPQLELKLDEIGIEFRKYNTTCPFVERVWKKSEVIGKQGYTIIIHGKYRHEETRATFARSLIHQEALVIRDLKEAKILGSYITGERDIGLFANEFAGRTSENFVPLRDLQKIGVINQTTMLASETQEISNHLRACMIQKYGKENVHLHFADTRDTLCYATNENQEATLKLLDVEADFAIVAGGFNSSNTSHLAELLESKFPTYFISSEKDIASEGEIQHYDIHQKKTIRTTNFMFTSKKPRIILSSGASCPDAIIEGILRKILGFHKNVSADEAVIEAVLK